MRRNLDGEAGAPALRTGGEQAAAGGANIARKQGHLQHAASPPGHSSDAVGLIKPPRQSSFGDCRAVVADFDARLRGIASESQLDLPSGRAGLERLLHQPQDGATQRDARDWDHGAGVEVERDGAAKGFRQRHQILTHFLDQFPERGGLLGEAVGFRIGVFEEQVGNAHGAVRLEKGHVNGFSSLLRQGVAGLQQLESPVQDGERLAEFVDGSGQDRADFGGVILRWLELFAFR